MADIFDPKQPYLPDFKPQPLKPYTIGSFETDLSDQRTSFQKQFDMYLTFADVFTDENAIVSSIQHAFGVSELSKLNTARYISRQNFPPTPEYEMWKDPIYLSLPENIRHEFPDVRSEREAKLIQTYFKHRTAKRELHKKHPIATLFGSAGGAILSPGGYATIVAKTGKQLSLAAAIAVGDEAILRDFQPDRTPAESIMNVGFAIAGSNYFFNLARRINYNLKQSWANRPSRALAIYEGLAKSETYQSAVDAGLAPKMAEEVTGLRSDGWHTKPPEYFSPFEKTGVEGESILRGEPKETFEPRAKVKTTPQDEELIKTGMMDAIFSETSPVQRILQKGSNYGKTIVSELVEHPFFQRKNKVGEATFAGVDALNRVKWNAPLFLAIKETDKIYSRYRKRTIDLVENNNRDRALGVPGSQSDFFYKPEFDVPSMRSRLPGQLSQKEFFQEVAKAKRRLGGKFVHEIQEVVEAANLWNTKVYKPMEEAAVKNKMFSQHLRKEMHDVEDDAKIWINRRNEIDKTDIKNNPDAPKLAIERRELEYNIKIARKQYKALVQKIKYMDERYVHNPSYLNRIYNKEIITKERTAFEGLLVQHGLTKSEASKATDSILSMQVRGADVDPVGPIGERFLPEDMVGRASSLKERPLGHIPDTVLEPFLENNIVSLGRYYVSRVGPDIELTQKFGSIDMWDQINSVKTEWDAKIKKVKDGSSEQRDLVKLRDQEIEDIKVIRDRIRGTYGLPDNPDSWTHRSIRVAKMWNALSMLTGALAAVPDIARPIMFDGFTRTFGTTIDALTQGVDLIKLAKNEGQLAGEILDMVMNSRAAQISDIGDSMSQLSQFERIAADVTQQGFNINLMNPWNVMVKSIASLTTGSRILSESIKWSSPMRNSAKATIEYGEIISRSGLRGAASYNPKTNTVKFDIETAKESFEEKAWTRPKVKGVEPLPEDTFKTFNDWKDFLIEHELAHADKRPKKGMSLGEYENQINKIALKRMGARGSVSSEFEQTKLARSGIDAEMAARISAQFEEHGFRHGSVLIAKTENWLDKEAQLAYRLALSKDINMIIVTPGKGEIPNFMGGGLGRLEMFKEGAKKRKAKIENGEKLTFTEELEDLFMSPQMAQLLFQFKTFGIAASQRILVPGLQNKDMSLLSGIAMSVGLGILISDIRHYQSGSKRTRTTRERIMNGIDRSGVLGYFSDVNNAMQSLLDGRIQGIAGPTVSQGFNIIDVLSGDKSMRKISPGQNYAHLDFLYDFTEQSGGAN